MKISILTGNFGMGHKSAALAIQQQLEDNNLEADIEITDWFHYVSPKLSDKFYRLYTVLINKGSRFYNARYRFLENKKTDQKPELNHYFQWYFSKFMKEKRPDLIISTLPFCSQIVSIYKEKNNCTIPLVTCVTDITGHSEWISKNTELYLVGSQSVKDKFLQKGVLPENISETGIPVRLEFIKNTSPVKVPMRVSSKKLLIMGGGLGLLPENMEFYNALALLPNVEITLICGNNQNLFKLLSGKYRNINVLGYINNVCDYMKQADVIITKPGGITTFEAIHAEVPILALNPFMQQEMYNAQYIQEMQIGTVINGNGSKCVEDIAYILDCNQLEFYKNNIRKIKEQLVGNNITQVLMNVIYRSNYTASYNFTNSYKLKSKGREKHEKISFNL